MTRKGDTLIEVCVAIGIFSLVAIGVASVMSSGTAGSQTALETTLAREEIDAQAEALRFIHESYMSGKNNADNSYSKLWEDITEKAKDPSESIKQYSPSSCAELYEGKTLENQNAFVLNTKQLSNPNAAYIGYDSSTFRQTTTYPRVLFGNSETNNSGNDALVGDSGYNNVYRAEGIYIIAVKDQGTNMIVDSNTTKPASAYYDFYIRSCWYGTDADRPTAISTVIRLYDPPANQTSLPTDTKEVRITYDNNGSTSPTPFLRYGVQHIRAGTTEPLADPHNDAEYRKFAKTRFLCWSTSGDTCNGEGVESYPSGYEYGAETYNVKSFTLFAIWNNNDFKVTYKAGDSSTIDMSGFSAPAGSKIETTATSEGRVYNVTETIPAYSNREADYTILSFPKVRLIGWKFNGWCTQPVARGDTCPGKTYKPGDAYESGDDFYPHRIPGDITLYAVWGQVDEEIDVVLTWLDTPRDLDSHVQGQKSDGTFFHTYYSNRAYSEGYVIAALDQDITGGYGPETITLHTTGGRKYYYYVYCFSECSKIPNAKVVVKNKTSGEEYSFESNNSTGEGRYWNVFAIKDGEMVTPGRNGGTTSSSEPDISY